MICQGKQRIFSTKKTPEIQFDIHHFVRNCTNLLGVWKQYFMEGQTFLANFLPLWIQDTPHGHAVCLQPLDNTACPNSTPAQGVCKKIFPRGNVQDNTACLCVCGGGSFTVKNALVSVSLKYLVLYLSVKAALIEGSKSGRLEVCKLLISNLGEDSVKTETAEWWVLFVFFFCSISTYF